MKQRNWGLLTILLMLLSLTACGGGETTTNTPTTPAQTSPSSASSKLDTVKNRGTLICGVDGQLPGFSFVDETGEYSGIDVDICRAVAAAIFNDPTKVEFRNLSAQERFTAAQTGEIDLLSRNTTWTISRDTSVGMEFGPTIFYDGMGMMVTSASGIKTLEDLNGRAICVQSGTTTELNLADQMSQRGLEYTPVVFEDTDAVYAAYQEGRCEGVTSDRSQLVSRKVILPNPDDHVILDTVLSKEPLGPAVVNGDTTWSDTVKWVVFALIQAEEFGIDSTNIDSFNNTEDPNIRRFLGLEGSLGEDMGLSNDFAARVVRHVGNYGEVYERNIAEPLKLERGPNKLWTDGGLLYSPPFR